jgi:hypothetical protein
LQRGASGLDDGTTGFGFGATGFEGGALGFDDGALSGRDRAQSWLDSAFGDDLQFLRWSLLGGGGEVGQDGVERAIKGPRLLNIIGTFCEAD